MGVWLLVAALLLYANGDAWIAMRRRRPLHAPVNPRHLSMLALALYWAKRERFSLRELGIGQRGLTNSVLWGGLVGVIGSIPLRIFLGLPTIAERAVTQPNLAGVGRRRLLVLLVGQAFLSTAVFEEVVFRGVLQAWFARRHGPRRAGLLVSGLFAAWHLVVVWSNLAHAGLPRAAQAVLYPAALALLFAVGVVLGELRRRTGHVAGAVLAHWLLIAGVIVRLAQAGKREPPPPHALSR